MAKMSKVFQVSQQVPMVITQNVVRSLAPHYENVLIMKNYSLSLVYILAVLLKYTQIAIDFEPLRSFFLTLLAIKAQQSNEF